MNKVISRSFFLYLLAFASVVYAEPSEISKYLLNEPVDWMTYGLKQLDESFEDEPQDYDVGSLYNFGEDRISIILHPTKEIDPTGNVKENAEAFCKQSITSVKKKLFIDANGAPASTGDTASWMANYFRPWGYAGTKIPKNFDRKLDSITQILMRVCVYDGKKQTCLDCKSALREAQIYVSDVSM